MIFTNLIQSNLTTKNFGSKIENLNFTNSTNEDIWERVNQSAKEGLVIITDQQRNGKGRRCNTWISEPGSSLTFSFLIKPKFPFEKIGLLSLLTGVAVVEGISKSTNINCTLKWPNDVILNNKKIGGILIETKKKNNDIYLVIGIGININEQEIPKELQNIASSLKIEKSTSIQREPLLAFILNEFENLYLHHWNEIISLWQEYCIHENDEVTFHINDQLHCGTFQGITDTGHAMIRINGKTETFTTGMVTL